jgi:hypothetical protein
VTGPEEAFAKLLGRQPSDAEKQGLYRAREALGLKENDALWLLLLALGHYESLYARFPELIKSAAARVLADLKEAATAEMQASAAATKRDLADAVARTAKQVARATATKRMAQWAIACVATCAACITLVAWLAWHQSAAAAYARGWGEAYRAAADQKAAASWANTPEGQLAYGLATVGSIRELASCSGRGWIRKDDICYPRPERGAVHGWRLSMGGGRRPRQ